MARRRAPEQQGRLLFVTGGAASGKSRRALELAGEALPRAFVATGQPLDDEMAERIRRHRVERGTDWETAEVPIDLARWFDENQGRYRSVVLDCTTLWLSNLLERGVPDAEVPRLVEELLQAVRRMDGTVVIVGNELGMGLVPMEKAARRFRDVAGMVNQRIAQEADAVYFAVSGLLMPLK
jgi:adenosylcobinamide kinase/adenosylcobinamide-phosphate guanylyltransferase